MVQLPRQTVAVIGLEPAPQTAFSDLLRREGYVVICCKDEDEARTISGGASPDFIVTRPSAAGRAEERLLEARKLGSTSRIAHEFNNLLTVINGYSALVLGRVPAGDPLRPALEEIEKAGDRAVGLVQQLLAVGGEQEPRSEPLSLNDIVGGVRKNLLASPGAAIEVVCDIDPDLRPVLADRHAIEQVILKMSAGARDAMPAGGRLTLQTANVRLDGVCPQCREVIASGPFVLLTVRGSGKDAGQGLEAISETVARSGGHVCFESDPGTGSAFHVYLPALTPPSHAQSAVHERRPAGEAPKILVVDDEEAVRRCLRAVLEEAGYTVAEAADGREAIEHLQRATPDLVITDLVMPEQEGIETIQSLRRDHPSIGIIAISGAGEGRYLPMARLLGADAALPKPASPQQVLAEVERILGKRS